MAQDGAVALCHPGGHSIPRDDEATEVGGQVRGIAIELVHDPGELQAPIDVLFGATPDDHGHIIVRGPRDGDHLGSDEWQRAVASRVVCRVYL
jgi:hypothetical protein